MAKAFNYSGIARTTDDMYTLVIDDPFGLRCGDIYYGPAYPTHDVYTWDKGTMRGTLDSTFDIGCDGAPGQVAYDFTLSRV
ncbi:hypothetical protein [Mycobacterium sp. 236(2023)]|uniref:hypothetical protein n=1 Tax=Mycobacterium sp. 236(2023) TaxID=3038163 RepID=UPI00241510FE|nr:hypothetical protein [Mycobacterium sp. 236(2023)]MDG4667925.1 hypothetical protein [Mycobacterium sp. 236(2023)]